MFTSSKGLNILIGDPLSGEGGIVSSPSGLNLDGSSTLLGSIAAMTLHRSLVKCERGERPLNTVDMGSSRPSSRLE